MSGYRDERDALRARSESLEQELAAARRDVKDLQGDGPAKERLERLTRELAEAEQEIARLRGTAPPRRPPVFFGGAAGSVGVAILATMWLFGARQIGSMPCQATRAPASMPLTPMIVEPIADGADLPSSRPTCARTVTTGHVVEVDGAARVALDATCDVEVTPKAGQCKVAVTCGDLSLYDGYARPAGEGRVIDDQVSAYDHDPRIVVDTRSGHVEVSDDGVTRWSVKLDLGSPAQ